MIGYCKHAFIVFTKVMKASTLSCPSLITRPILYHIWELSNFIFSPQTNCSEIFVVILHPSRQVLG
jgi:hypothetical protein